MKTAKRLLALALAGVMTLALLTGCSDSSSKTKQVEECFRTLRKTTQNVDYQKDETLDKKLEVIAQKFQPSWLDNRTGGLTEDARTIIKNELGDYLVSGSVWLWYGEVEPGQSAQAQAESHGRRALSFVQIHRKPHRKGAVCGQNAKKSVFLLPNGAKRAIL